MSLPTLESVTAEFDQRIEAKKISISFLKDAKHGLQTLYAGCNEQQQKFLLDMTMILLKTESKRPVEQQKMVPLEVAKGLRDALAGLIARDEDNLPKEREAISAFDALLAKEEGV